VVVVAKHLWLWLNEAWGMVTGRLAEILIVRVQWRVAYLVCMVLFCKSNSLLTKGVLLSRNLT